MIFRRFFYKIKYFYVFLGSKENFQISVLQIQDLWLVNNDSGINNQITVYDVNIFIVDSDVVLQMYKKMHSNFRIFLIEEIIILMLYFVWLMYLNHLDVVKAKKLANTDILTGLQNRNIYASFCEKNKNNTQDLCCIYIDANGLHEINNNEGHLAGDRMLRFIADTLKVTFGEDSVYRIGGDEFVVFLYNMAEYEIKGKINSAIAAIERNDYHASVGCCIGKDSETIDTVVKIAEKEMYDNKKLYYEKTGRQVRNQKKE